MATPAANPTTLVPVTDPAAPRLVLASASPARLAVLRAAGVNPQVQVSRVDEPAVQASLPSDATPEAVVTALAKAKATDVVESLVRAGTTDALIVGADSMLFIDGALVGKPSSVDEARTRWRTMAGHSGTLITGHAVVNLSNGVEVGARAAASSTVVHFGSPDDDELEAYLGSGEPLRVAGAFTLDGLGGWFVESVEGDPSSVIGISLPLLRRLLSELEIDISALWAGNPV